MKEQLNEGSQHTLHIVCKGPDSAATEGGWKTFKL